MTPIAEEKSHWVQLNLRSIIDADAGAFAILVSYGAVLGLLSPLQVEGGSKYVSYDPERGTLKKAISITSRHVQNSYIFCHLLFCSNLK